MKNLEQLEQWIRLGEFSKVTAALTELKGCKIPRVEVVRLAHIANRVDQARFAFRLLNPIVRAEQPLATPADDSERMEYGEALRRMGLVNEAIEIFRSIDADRVPIVHLRMALCLFKKWRYAEAIPHLRLLVGALEPSDYLCTIAKVNLAAALAHEDADHGEALSLLENVKQITRESGQKLLLGNSLELTAQIFIGQREWTAAETVLSEAETIFSKEQTKYLLWVRKWRAIAHGLKNGIVHKDLESCRSEAIQNEDWETLRDCDFYCGLINHDLALLQKVYFGTSHASFRKRILKTGPRDLKIPFSYVWEIGGGRGPVFDVVNGTAEDGRKCLDPGRILHRLMILLCSDFYQPLSMGTTFSTLFPDEHFSQDGSANRVSRHIARLRKWMETEGLQLGIVQNNGKYRLHSETGFRIRVTQDMLPDSPEHFLWDRVRPALSRDEFSRQDVVREAQCSVSTAKRLLKWALDSGQAQCHGYGGYTKYRMTG